MGCKQFGIAGRPCTGTPPVEQAHGDGILQCADTLADRRLADLHGSGGAREGAEIQYSDEVPQLGGIHTCQIHSQ
jgi:hypothetical protein